MLLAKCLEERIHCACLLLTCSAFMDNTSRASILVYEIFRVVSVSALHPDVFYNNRDAARYRTAKFPFMLLYLGIILEDYGNPVVLWL